MYLSQDKFAEKVWLENQYGFLTKEKIESIMKDCNLKYRKNKVINDLYVAIGNGYKTFGNSEKVLEQIAEEIDKVLIRSRWE